MLKREGSPDTPALARLLARRPPVTIRWGLERIRFMLDGLGRPELSFTSIHVAGTNGKGSVAATAESVLRHAGLQTGLYTSPHLVAFSERIQVDGQAASPELLEATAAEVLPLAEQADATFFEAATALGFACFARAGVEAAVVEVGLGGRLDATNVVEAPVGVVTSIDLDHADYLGDDIEAIAVEKAGIIAPGSAVVIGALTDPAARVVLEAASTAAATPWLAGRDFFVEWRRGATTSFRGGPCDRRLELRSPFVGPHQATNVALAVVAVDLLLSGDGFEGAKVPEDGVIERAVAAVAWPGRFDVRRHADGTWLYDIAHNPAAAVTLAALLDESDLPRPLVLLASVLGDKDWGEILSPLLEVTDRAVLTLSPSSPPSRRWDLDRVRESIDLEIQTEPDFATALERARVLAGAGTVVVTGSAFAVGDALRWNDAGEP